MNSLGCFGFATTFDSTSAQCKGCSNLVACAEKVEDTLNTLEGEGVNVGDLLKKVQHCYDKNGITKTIGSTQTNMSVALSMDDKALVDSLPKNVAALVKSIVKKGVDISASIKRNSNPFKHCKPEYMRGVCELLLVEKEFTATQVEAYIQNEKPLWNRTTIKNHASIARRALLALNVIQQIDGKTFRRVEC